LEDRRIIFANGAVEYVFGWKPEELIGRSTRMLYPTEEEYEEIGRRGYGTLETQRSFVATEFPCKHKDGKIIVCRIHAARIGKSLTSKKIVVTYEDITEQKKAEEKLRESEELYRSLAERSFAGVYLVQDGIFRFINKNAASYAGYTQDELVSRKSYIIVHPEDRKKVKRNAEEMLKGQRTSPYEFRVLTKKGAIRWIMETVTPITVRGGPAVLGNSMDITELRDAKSKLEEFKDLELSILDATPHAIFSLQERKIIFANDAVESVFGWKPQELIGKSTRVLYSANEDFERLGQKAYAVLEKQRNFTEPEFPCWRKDGRVITCRINASRIGKSLQNRKVVVTYEDITEQKKAEEALRERQKQLEIQTRNLEEINTALNVLLKKREDDKKVLEENILSNVKELIMPCVEMIRKGKMDYKTRMCVDTIESNLNDITSPFLRTLSSKYLKLTPKEILIAGLLKDGKATKEIVELLNTSVRGIEFHRENIRMKLGLKNKKENLRSYLMAMSSDD
jgi:PAS domain S-box-containing protein